MSATITVTQNIVSYIPNSYVGEVLTYASLVARVNPTDSVILEYSTSTKWRAVGNEAQTKLQALIDWFTGHCSVPLVATVSDLMSQLNRLDFLTNVYLSFTELAALLLLAADRYHVSPDPNGHGNHVTVTPRVSVRRWTETASFAGCETSYFVSYNDIAVTCNLPVNMTTTYDKFSLRDHGFAGNISQGRYELLSGEVPPVYYENGVLANAGEYTVESVTEPGMMRAGNLTFTHNVQNHTITTPFGDLSYSANPHKIWMLVFRRGNSISGRMYYSEHRVVQDSGPGVGTVDFSNPALSGQHNNFFVNVATKSVTKQSDVTIECGYTRLPWMGLIQRDAQFTPGYSVVVDVDFTVSTLNRAGEVGPNPAFSQNYNEDLSVGVGELSHYSRGSTTSVQQISSTPDNVYSQFDRSLISVNDVLDVDVYNLPDYTSDVIHADGVAAAFSKITAVDDPYLRFCASITSLYVAEAIIESLTMSLAFGHPMQATFGVGDNTAFVRYVNSDGQPVITTPALARESDDLDVIVAQYTTLSYDIQDRMLMASAITDAQSTYDSIADAVEALAKNVETTVQQALLQAADPYVAKQAMLDVTYAETVGVNAMQDVISAAVAAGATSAADVIAYIDAYAPQFSLSMTGEPAAQLRLALGASNYEGYDEYFTNNTPSPSFGSSVPFFSKTGAGMISADTEGEVLDAKLGAMCVWPPVFQTTVLLPSDLLTHLRQQTGSKVITVPLRHSYMVIKPRPETTGNAASLVWLARFSGGGDQALVNAIESSAEEFRSVGQAMLRCIAADDSLLVTVGSWQFDAQSAYDPATRDLENAMAALTYAGSGALIGSVAGLKGVAVGAAVGSLVGITAAAFSGSDGTEDDVWDVARARSIISESMSNLAITSDDSHSSCATTNPREALSTLAATFLYAVYRGLWLPISTPSGTDPIGYALITDAMPTPRFYQIPKVTDYVPMVLTAATVLTVAGVAMYAKPSKIRIKREKVKKDANGKLVDESAVGDNIRSLSFGSVRARACIPSVIFGSAISIVASAASGIRAAVKARAARSEQRRLFSTVSEDLAVDKTVNEYITDDVIPLQENAVELAEDILGGVRQVLEAVNRDHRTYYV